MNYLQPTSILKTKLANDLLFYSRGSVQLFAHIRIGPCGRFFSVKGQKEIWNPISPGYSAALRRAGSGETTSNVFGGDMDGPEVKASL